jgi:hypothetical protein
MQRSLSAIRAARTKRVAGGGLTGRRSTVTAPLRRLSVPAHGRDAAVLVIGIEAAFL